MTHPIQRFYQQARMRPNLIHRVCPYTNGAERECKGCGPWDESDYGPVQRGCYALAVEMIAIVLEDAELQRIQVFKDQRP